MKIVIIALELTQKYGPRTRKQVNIETLRFQNCAVDTTALTWICALLMSLISLLTHFPLD